MKFSFLLFITFVCFFVYPIDDCDILDLNKSNISNSALLQAPTISPSKNVFKVNESIVINFTGAAGNTQDWISISKSNSPVKKTGNWRMLMGQTDGAKRLDGMEEEGVYEVRLVFHGSDKIQAKCEITISNTLEDSPLEALETKSNSTTSNPGFDEEAYSKMVKDGYGLLSSLTSGKLGSGAGWVHSYFNTSDYLKEAQELNYPELLIATKEGKNKLSDASLDSKIKMILEFGNTYGDFYTETLSSVINGLIESAYMNKTKNSQESLKYASQAKDLSDAAISILPENQAVQALHKDAKNTIEKLGGEVLASIYTSEFHAKNAGEIVFFTGIPEIKNENVAMVKESYKAGDYIYAMAYLKGSFKDLTKATNDINVSTKIFVNGNEISEHKFRINWTKLKEGYTYLFMEIIPDPSTNKHSGPAKFAKELAAISPRNHTIKVTLNGWQVGGTSITELAQGSFQLNCGEGQDKLAQYAVKYREKSLAKVFMPKPGMTNTALNSSMVTALKNEGWEDDKTLQRVVITGDSWKIHRHAITGEILYRSISAVAAFKTNEGYCKYWDLTFKQNFNGSNYGKTEGGGVGNITEIACGNITR